MTGVGAFGLLYALLARAKRSSVMGWVGEHSLSLFLVHQPIVILCLGSNADDWGIPRLLIGIGAALVISVVAALALERAVNLVVTAVSASWAKRGALPTLIRLGAAGLICAALVFGGEATVEAAAPQEVNGWGERPSLEPDPDVGWHLIPNTTTRLRWETYDYVVTANSLGFPAPEYPVAKPANTVRIMTVGDAFTSAEGVDTDQAWARLLETDLAAQYPQRQFEVMNFGITGYGPQQYAEVVDQYAPVYQPDLIVVETFVNDFQDAITSQDALRDSIGFGQAAPFSASTFLRLMHLYSFMNLEVKTRVVDEFLNGKPNFNGYFLGNFAALEVDQPDYDQAIQAVSARYQQIRTAADRLNAQLMFVMVPASVQVCAPQDLRYYPRDVDLHDSSSYDLDLPQRTMQGIVDDLHTDFFDLRPALDAAARCPYQPNNMHWLPLGHQIAAEAVMNQLVDDHMLPTN